MTRHQKGCPCTRCCDLDMLCTNPIHDLERTEAGAARAALTETQRAQGCGHTAVSIHGVCLDCGEDLRSGL